MSNVRWRRILLKLSGEALARGGRHISTDVLDYIAREIADVRALGVQVGVVIGGGNIVRGQEMAELGTDRVKADQMGMLGTVINAIAIASTLERHGLAAEVQAALSLDSIVPRFSQVRAVQALQAGTVVVFAAGTGNPFFTTDTAAALRAAEIGADVLFKATNVDGIYDSDPKKNPAAVRYDTLTFTRALADNLKVMDAAALGLARENDIPLVVFRLLTPGNLVRAVTGEAVGTLVREEA